MLCAVTTVVGQHSNVVFRSLLNWQPVKTSKLILRMKVFCFLLTNDVATYGFRTHFGLSDDQF